MIMRKVQFATCQTCGRPTVKNEGGSGNRTSTGRIGGGMKTGWGEKRIETVGTRSRFLTGNACCCVACRGGRVVLHVKRRNEPARRYLDIATG